MLSTIAIRNFQSLHSVTLDLSPFTVVVGPSSSGKSAFTRALRTLVSNARGTSYITHGERQTTITAHTPRGVVVLNRGATDSYQLIPDDGSEPRTWTKLGGTVPDDISRALGIEPGDPINFGGQWDMPYLLSAGGSHAAKTLGDLTNVSVIFAAVAEANRRRARDRATLSTRAADRASLMERIETFRPLKAQVVALTQAETALDRAERAQARLDRLASLVSSLDIAQGALTRARDALAIPAPTPERIEAAQGALQRYSALVRELSAQTGAERLARNFSAELTTEHGALLDQYTAALVTAGECPTCGQATAALTTNPHAEHPPHGD